MHLCEQTQLGGEGDAWSCRLPVKALQFGALLSDYIDSVDKKVAQFFTENLEATAASDGRPTAGPGGAPGAGKVRVRDALQQTLRVSATHLTTQTLCRPQHSQKASRNARPLAGVERAAQREGHQGRLYLAARSSERPPCPLPLRAIELCHFGTAGLGTTTHGTPIVWLVKQPLVAAEASYAHYVNMLTAIDFRVANYQALSHVGEGVDQPPTSPTLTLPPVPTEADAVAGAALLRGLKQG